MKEGRALNESLLLNRIRRCKRTRKRLSSPDFFLTPECQRETGFIKSLESASGYPLGREWARHQPFRLTLGAEVVDRGR
jgi:hypothetical protein